MNGSPLGLTAALWLGILTSISPCPLATNIAAISYVGRRVDKTSMVFFAGLLYTLGRSLAYLLVGIPVAKGLISIPVISNFLQKYLNLFIGPIIVFAGVLLLDMLKFGFGGKGMSNSLRAKIDRMGIWGAGLLGFLLALAFCPASAGLFFGGLVPLAIKNNSAVLLPIIYGVGTALPVIGFSFLLAFGAHLVGSVFNKLTVIELWVRRTTAIVMILAGIVLILKNNFGLYFGI